MIASNQLLSDATSRKPAPAPISHQRNRRQCLAPQVANGVGPVMQEEIGDAARQSAACAVEIEVAAQAQRFQIADQRIVERCRPGDGQRGQCRAVEQRQRQQLVFRQGSRRTLLDSRQQRLERLPVGLAFRTEAGQRLADGVAARARSQQVLPLELQIVLDQRRPQPSVVGLEDMRAKQPQPPDHHLPLAQQAAGDDGAGDVLGRRRRACRPMSPAPRPSSS